MILVAGGDSFIYGSELSDSVTPFDPNGVGPAQPQVSKSTYPALISKELELEYYCAARPGNSNSAIRRTIMNVCETTPKVGLVFATWSFPCRYEFRFRYEVNNECWYSINPWSTSVDENQLRREFENQDDGILQHHLKHFRYLKEKGVSDFSDIFYNHVGSGGYWEIYTTLCDIVMLQQYLEIKKIPYIFTAVDESVLNNYNHWNDLSIVTLISQIDLNKWIWFPNNLGFYTWAKSNNYRFGTTHPLEEAHEDAAKYIMENYYDMVKKLLQQN